MAKKKSKWTEIHLYDLDGSTYWIAGSPKSMKPFWCWSHQQAEKQLIWTSEVFYGAKLKVLQSAELPRPMAYKEVKKFCKQLNDVLEGG